MRSRIPAEFLTTAEAAAVEAAIGKAEERTSGEIRVHIAPSLPKTEIYQEGRKIFRRMGMDATRRRNGVLILLGLESQNYLVLADVGVNQRVAPDLWKTVGQTLAERFQKGEFQQGLVACIDKIAEVLAPIFPRKPDDTDELSNKISFG